MKSVIVLILSLSILISSCISTHQLLYCMTIKEKAEGKTALIKLKNGVEIEGEIIEVGIDSTLIKNNNSTEKKFLLNENISIPAVDIAEIHLKDSWNGSLEGVGYGLLAGILLGSGVAVIESDRFSVFWIPAGAIIGGLIGIPVGAIIGHRDEYVFSESFPYEYVKVKLEKL